MRRKFVFAEESVIKVADRRKKRCKTWFIFIEDIISGFFNTRRSSVCAIGKTQGLVWTDLSWGAARPTQTKMFVPTKIIWMQDMRNFKIDYTSIPHVQIIAVNWVKNLNIWVEKLILAETNKSNVINLIQVKSSMCWRPLCISGVCCRSLIVITRRLYWLVWKISNKDI